MRLPLGGHGGQVQGLLRRQPMGCERDDAIDLALALHVGERRPIATPPIFEEQLPSVPPRRLR